MTVHIIMVRPVCFFVNMFPPSFQLQPEPKHKCTCWVFITIWMLSLCVVWLRSWPTEHCWGWQRYVFCSKLHHITAVNSTPCLALTHEEGWCFPGEVHYKKKINLVERARDSNYNHCKHNRGRHCEFKLFALTSHNHRQSPAGAAWLSLAGILLGGNVTKSR